MFSSKPIDIFGEGCVGLAVAYMVSKQGKAVVVVEREEKNYLACWIS